MEATAVELRHRMREILKSVERNETVVVTRRGKPFAKLVPVGVKSPSTKSLRNHVFFGMYSQDERPVSEAARSLRVRNHAV